MLATGHYIQRRDGINGPEMARAVDPDRDQSYFLFATTPEQLRNLWFPLGGMPKAQVRELARKFALPVAEKADSQDICFVPTGRYTSVIERLKPGALQPGDIVHVDGRHLGRHDGIVNYTIGQRKGLKISGPEPLYVVAWMRRATRSWWDRVTACARRGFYLETPIGWAMSRSRRRRAADCASGRAFARHSRRSRRR